ncbi:DNA methyltransferase [Candidatus Poseidonia alphae]|nr:DNA methyltransferase [Candidatus Poseidonia alphae]
MSKKIEKLKTLLNELFRLDQPDLDFGIYRIMRARSEEITKYLEEGLLPQVKDAFEQYKSGDIDVIENEIKIAIKGAKDAGFEPDEAPRVIELRKKLADESIDLDSIENEVFDHLYNFFRRYYDKGDFLSKRVYKPGVYAIPYEGEDVKLHWANSDQYYVKTSEYLKNYSFCLQPDNDENPMRVNFELIDADEGEHGNINEQENKTRRFLLAAEPFCSVENNELIIRFTHEIKSTKQNKINDGIEQSILDLKDEKLTKWTEKLKMPHTRKDGIESANIRLRIHLDRYTKRNNSDYFIHKDLNGFLRREIDFYIKNEVMHLDDIENDSVPKVEQYLSKIKVIRNIATKVIQFLAQIEDFQKKIWRKKKFVVETNYCITLDRVPEELFSEIAANEAQCDEWVNLFAIDEIETNLFDSGYSRPLTIEFLKVNQSLVLDTQFFDDSFKAKLIDSFDSFDEQCEGVLVHSNNYHGLNLLAKKHESNIDCIYIDPPYNTDSNAILYKNNYKHSSWLSLMNPLLQLSARFEDDEHGVQIIAIDEAEVHTLTMLLHAINQPKVVRPVSVIINPGGQQDKNLKLSGEYAIFVYDGSKESLAKQLRDPEDSDPKLRPDLRKFRNGAVGNTDDWKRTSAKNMFYPVYVKDGEIIGFGDVCDDDFHPPKNIQRDDGVIEVYPIHSNSTKDKYGTAEGKWLVARQNVENWTGLNENGDKEFQDRRLHVLETDGKIDINQEKFLIERKSIWTKKEYSAKEYGTTRVGDLIPDTLNMQPLYPKSIHLVEDCIKTGLNGNNSGVVLDYFAGSGTTGHAVINLNREDAGNRKYILIEMGSHFDNVTKPLIQKVIYDSEWKKGKPAARTNLNSHCFKYIRLESYEDALNNLQLNRNDNQKFLFDFEGGMADDEFKEQYLLNYMLELESAGCQSLLNISDFMTPTEYKMNIKRPGSDESNVMNVDLIETFNWLIGITVKHLSKPQFITAEFLQDGEGRLCVNGELQPDEEGAWWFRSITGTLPDGRQTLVIWRNRPGGEDSEGVERDNLMLNEWFSKQKYDDAEGAFNLVYVNCSNNLEVLKKPEDNWSVRMIEDDFFNLMFE